MTIRLGPRRAATIVCPPFAADDAVAAAPYQVAGFNFPINFLPAGPVHGAGRQALAIVPGSCNKLKTVEQAWRRPGPNDGRVLRFRFELAEHPENVDDGFGFLIDDFWLPRGGSSLLLSAWISVAFGPGRLRRIDVTASSRLLATRPFSLMFATPPGLTWSSFLALAKAEDAGRRLTLDYFIELTPPPARAPIIPRRPRRHRRLGLRRRWTAIRAKPPMAARHH